MRNHRPALSPTNAENPATVGRTLNAIRRYLVLHAMLILTGCATLDAKVAVPVSCIKGEPPAMPQTASEAELLAMSEYASTLTIWTERLELKAFALKAESLLQACK